jgi:hypothetical protein
MKTKCLLASMLIVDALAATVCRVDGSVQLYALVVNEPPANSRQLARGHVRGNSVGTDKWATCSTS